MPKDLIVKSIPWNEIEVFYHTLVFEHGWPIASMLQMVEMIANSDYAKLLYGATSHEVLLVSATPEFAYNRDMLRIEPFAEKLVFKYHESPHRDAAMVRECKGAEGFTVFERMVRMRQWIVEYNEARGD